VIPDRARDPRAAGVRIVISGVLDRAAVGTVEDAVRAGLRAGPRVEVDVRAVERWVDDALGSLADCARLGTGVEFLMEGKGRVRGAGS
jgi:hypothetical protein